MKLEIKPSSRKDKKFMAIFTSDNDKVKITHFGAKNMNDYTLTGDKKAREKYRARHKKDLETNDPTRAGYLSYFILWGDSDDLEKNIKNYKKKYNFK